MAKIPFDIKYRNKIESGEYKVETRNGKPARIICWNKRDKYYPIIALYVNDSRYETFASYNDKGEYYLGSDDERNLFIVTPEPELTEFECAMLRYLQDGANAKSDEKIEELTKKHSAELLAIARKEIEKDLPRWKEAERDYDSDTIDFAIKYPHDGGDHDDYFTIEVTNRLRKGDYYIELADLDVLPGFKEE